MSLDEDPGHRDETELQSIPEQEQDISTEELVESNYEAMSSRSSEDGGGERRMRHYAAALSPPGRTRHDDSINASSDDPGGSPHVDAYKAGYDSPMATRIGDEDDGDGDVERLRELHDGRHRSDGELSTRQSRWDKTRIAEAICSDLPLAQHERDKVVSVVERLDFSKFGQQKGLEGVTLGVVAVVVDERHRQRVDGDIVSFTDDYREICDSVGVSMSDLATIKKIVREALDNGDVTMGPLESRRDPLLPGPTPVEEYPREYWDGRPPERWASNAKNWSELPEEFKEAVPDKYRDLIENLRKWEPWAEEEEDPASSHEAGRPDASEPVDMDEVKKEAEELVDEMSDESTE